MKILFWLLVAIDALALVVFGLLGLAAAGPSRTNPVAALIIPFFLPGAILAVAIALFLAGSTAWTRGVALLIAALPLLVVGIGKARVVWELQGYRDRTGTIREYRSDKLQTIEEAIRRNDPPAIRAAGASRSELNTRGISGATPLVLAVRQLRQSPDRIELVRALLDGGADPNLIGPELPLQTAIGESRTAGVEPVRLLLDAGANPNARTAEGSPVFFIGGGANIQMEVMELLLAHGADVRLKDSQGRSVVVLPAIVGNWRVLSLVLQKGAPWRDQQGIVGVPLLEYLEGEARKSDPGKVATNGLGGILTFLRSPSGGATR